jgi:hypothetical protein
LIVKRKFGGARRDRTADLVNAIQSEARWRAAMYEVQAFCSGSPMKARSHFLLAAFFRLCEGGSEESELPLSLYLYLS